MGSYELLTDSGCDISLERLGSWDVRCIDLTLYFTDDNKAFEDHSIDKTTFYNQMRDGRIAKTSAINAETFRERFKEVLDQGQDVFYLAFSSGLSSTYNTACMMAEELMEEYPDRKIVVVDSLSASSGHGLLLYLVKQKRDAGASLDELAEFTVEKRLKICHFFTVSDLVYLKRGGRLSAMKAAVATALNLKPLLFVDNEGHLIGYQNVRGRKLAIDKLAKECISKATNLSIGPIFISHGDCIEDAYILRDKIIAAGGPKDILIEDVGPVIGSHSGPGTLTVFFEAEKRE